MIEHALKYSAVKHEGRYLPNSHIPYFVHPAEVMYYLTTTQVNDDIICAGILHDVLQYTSATKEDLLENFGEKITNMVLNQTQDNSLSWEQRLLDTENRLTTAKMEDMLICCCDKISDLKCILFSETDVWQCFEGTQQDYFDHHTKLKQLFLPLQYDYPLIYEQYCKYYQMVFKIILRRIRLSSKK